MADVITSCTIKLLPQNQWIAASRQAVAINAANASSTHMLQFVSPQTIISPQHLSLLTAKYWGKAGVRLTVGFLDNPAADLRAKILSHMNAWSTTANANVEFVDTSGSAQVRIARTSSGPNAGFWSYLGTDILSISAAEPTMNLDSFTMATSDSEFHRVVRHETGHTLGFPHEHMRSEIIDRIDREAAIAAFMASQGWSRDQVIAQVLTPLDNSALIATAHADPQSIMCYWLPASIMKDGVAVPGGADIDQMDADFAASVYPRISWHWANQGTPPGQTIAAGVGVLTMMDTPASMQRPYAFVRSTNGHLWVNWWDGHAWHWADQGTPPGQTIAAEVGVLTMKDTPASMQRPYAFVRSTNGHLWVNWWDGHAWHWADQGTPPGQTIAAEVGVLTMMDTPASMQRPYAFVRSTNGHLWVNWWDGHAWHWADQGTPPGQTVAAGVGVLTMMDTPTSMQRPYAFVRSTNGHLWVNWWDGHAWHWADQGTPQGQTVAAGVGVLTMMDTPASMQRPYAFVRSTNGHLWVNWWDGHAWHWADQGTPQGQTVAAGVGVLTMMDTPASMQRPYAFVRSTNGHLWVNWWDGHAWHWADQGTPQGQGLSVAAGVGVLTMKDTPASMQRPYAFVHGSDGHLWVNWWG